MNRISPTQLLIAFSLLLHCVARAQAPNDAEAKRRATVLATFQGGQITVADMEDAIAKQVPHTRAELSTPAARARFLTEMVTYAVLGLEAERRGYATRDAVVEAVDRKLIERTVDQDYPKRPEAVSAAEVAAEFERQRKQLERPPQRRASQIWVRTEREARALIAQLKNGDRTKFAKLARERSQDEHTRSRGGDLGLFDQEGRFSGSEVGVRPELAKATMALAHVGDITRTPVPEGGGFSILMWTESVPGSGQKLENAQDTIRAQLAGEKQRAALEAWQRDVAAKIKPEVHPERADAIALDPVPPLDIPSGFPAAPPDPTAPPVLVEPDGI